MLLIYSWGGMKIEPDAPFIKALLYTANPLKIWTTPQ